jgi:hypothetical protein
MVVGPHNRSKQAARFAERPITRKRNQPGHAGLRGSPITLLYRVSGGGLMGMFHESRNTKVASYKKIDRHRWT